MAVQATPCTAARAAQRIESAGRASPCKAVHCTPVLVACRKCSASIRDARLHAPRAARWDPLFRTGQNRSERVRRWPASMWGREATRPRHGPRATLQNMGKQSSAQATGPKRLGNPAWVKGGPSPNPRGRPRSSFALAERIRERMSPDELIDMVTKALADDKIDIERRIALAMQLASYGYAKTPAGVDLHVSGGAGGSADDYRDVPLEDRRAILAELHERLAAARSRASGDEPAPIDVASAQVQDPRTTDEKPSHGGALQTGRDEMHHDDPDR